MGRIPDFINIGAMKCGTTSLHHYLDEHPDVGMSATKEPNYFRTNEEFSNKEDWYLASFPEGDLVLGESSPDYSKSCLYPGVPERIKKKNPEIKIIYLVRDPIDRLVSHIWHNLICGREKSLQAVLQNLDAQSKYVQIGMYASEMEHYRRIFRPEQLHVVLFENLRDRPQETMEEIFDFIWVDKESYGKNAFVREHASQDKAVYGPCGRTALRLQKALNLGQIIPESFKNIVKQTLGRQNEVPMPKLSSEVEDDLRELFVPDAKLLQQLYDLDLTPWKRLLGRASGDLSN